MGLTDNFNKHLVGILQHDLEMLASGSSKDQSPNKNRSKDSSPTKELTSKIPTTLALQQQTATFPQYFIGSK